MSKLITIGKDSAGKKVAFDLGGLITTRLLIQANSGAGKSYLLRVLMEQMFPEIQIICIDPEGDFASLRQKYPFVLVGKDGDTAADVRTAGLLAERLLELKVSAICDLYEMKEADRHLWVKNFLTAMINVQKKLWHPVIVIIDEAQMFCPEGKGDAAAAQAVKDLCTRGRKRGFCAVLATQSLADLNKSATKMLLNRLVGGTFEDVDVKRSLDLLSVLPEDKRAVSHQMRTMEPGSFFAFGRAISKQRVLFNARKAETTHSEPGSAKHSAAPPPPPDKVKELLPQLADLPKEAAERAETLETLKTQLRNVKAELAAAKRTQPAADPTAVQKAVEAGQVQLRKLLGEAMKVIAKITAEGFNGAGIKDEDVRKALESAAGQIVKMAETRVTAKTRELETLSKEAQALAAKIRKALAIEEEISVNVNVKHQAPFTVRETKPALTRSAPAPAAVTIGDVHISAPQQSILMALAKFEAIGRTAVPKKWVAALAGASHTSSAYGNNLGALRSNGLISYPCAGLVQITEEGRAAAPAVDAPTSAQEMLQQCKGIVSAPQAKILDVLCEHYPKAIDKAQLAELAGASATSSAFGNNLGALRSAGMIDYPGSGQARAASWLFLESEAA